MKIILLDMDGPLANLELGFLNIWRTKFPNEFFIPISDRKKFYLTEEYPQSLKDKIETVLSSSNFFLDLPPVEAGLNAVKEMVITGLELVICSSGIYKNKNSLGEKRLWIDRHLGEEFSRKAIFAKDKTLIRGHYLIDDNPNISTGIVKPEWKHVIFDQPFNRDSKNEMRIKSDWSNWREALL